MPNLFEQNEIAHCRRCGAKCKVDPVKGSKAAMLKRGSTAKGYCINCAVHDCLRNLYPINLLLARSGQQCLLLPHIQHQFYQIARSAGTDAWPDEISWRAVVNNWELPFPDKLKPRCDQPVTQEELDAEAKKGPMREAMLRAEFEDHRSVQEICRDIDKRANEYFLKKIKPLLDEDI